MQRSTSLDPSESRAKIQDNVYSGLRESLIEGRFDAGQVLTMAALANVYGTSLMPVREALQRLVAEQALIVLPNGSAVVPHINIERLDDICRARVILERSAVEIAAPNMTSDNISDLENIAAQHREIAGLEGAYTMLSMNRRFHFQLYSYAGSSSLLQLIETLWLSMGPYMRLMSRNIEAQIMGGDPIYAGTHDDIVDALRAHDTLRAGDAITADIRATQALLHTILAKSTHER